MDLTTHYLGLELEHPVVASAGPLSQTVAGVQGLVDGGASAVVLYSLFEEQLRAEVARDEQLIDVQSNAFAEALDYFPTTPITTRSAAYSYLSLLERSAKAVDVPVIASLNGADLGGWVEFSRELADAGASAIELNIYLVPGDVKLWPAAWAFRRSTSSWSATWRSSRRSRTPCPCPCRSSCRRTSPRSATWRCSWWTPGRPAWCCSTGS